MHELASQRPVPGLGDDLLLQERHGFVPLALPEQLGHACGGLAALHAGDKQGEEAEAEENRDASEDGNGEEDEE